jgi:hypothetical protein
VPARAARIGFAFVGGGGGGGGGGAAFGNAIAGAANAMSARGNIDVVECITRVGVVYLRSRWACKEFESDV